MNKNKEKLYLIIFGICLIICIIIEFSLFINMSKLMASINDYPQENNVEYKTYERYQAVFFNPIEYKWCDYYSKKDNCYLWYVLKEEDNNRLSLVYGEVNDEWKTATNSKAETINNITSTWSDKLKIMAESKVEDAYSGMGPDRVSVDFTNLKARYLFDTDLTDEFVKLVGSNITYWYGGNDISKNVAISFINTTQYGSFTEPIVKFMGVLTKYESKNPSGPIDVPINNNHILPVIEVEKEKVGNEDYITNAIYLDPTNINKKCTKEEALSNLNAYGSPTEVKTGCMKWYVLDKNEEGVYKLILNHNTTAKTTHPDYVMNPGADNEAAPGRKALTDLVDVFNWQVTPRLITVDEISKLTDHENFNTDALSVGYFIEIPGNHFITFPSYYKSTKKYAYLLDYVARSTTGANSGDGAGNIDEIYDYTSYEPSCTWSNYCNDFPDGIDPDGGANLDPSNPKMAGRTTGVEGYWTQTKATAYFGGGYIAQYWLIEGDYAGLNFEDYMQDWGFGIRPVIETKIEYKYKVEYNDEERITSKEVKENEKAEEISSKGKDGYTFKYWSLDKINPYDFNTPITSDITLYAVYEINKYDIKFIDNEEEVKNIKVDYKTKIPSEEILEPTKEGYTFKYWSEDKENEFNFDEEIIEDKTLYSIYKKEEKCELSIESFMYNIDQENYTINNVPNDATNEEIMNNLTIQAQEKKIENDVVMIRCNREIKEYKINRTWIPKTGQVLIKMFPLIGYISIITVLLIAINKQREKNKRLRK